MQIYFEEQRALTLQVLSAKRREKFLREESVFPKQINDRLWILGNEYFHIYLIRGSAGCALYELGVSATAEVTLRQLADLRIRPDYLIVSHPHSDHITALEYLKEAFPDAKVMAGEGAREFISHPKAAQSAIAEDEHVFAAMVSRGFDSPLKPVAEAPSLQECAVVRDGDEIDLGGLTVSVMAVHGHSPGNILVHIPQTRTLLVSDSLGNHYPGDGFFPTFFTGYEDYLAAIDKIKAYKPRELGIAHNGFFIHPREIDDIILKARKAAEEVRAYVTASNKSDDEIAEDLFRFFYAGALAVYSPANIKNCCRLLVKRVREA